MKQIQKLKFGDFLIIILGIVFFVSASVVWGQKIFWAKKNKAIEKSITIKEAVIEELNLKNNNFKTENIREILNRANTQRVELAPIISDIWKLENPTVKFQNFSLNKNKMAVSASTISPEKIAQFIERLKRTPGVGDPLVTHFSKPSTDGMKFEFVFDRINK